MGDYDGLNYEKFREFANNESLSVYEKIGFPDSYRKDCEDRIFSDIVAKVPRIATEKQLQVLDIGPGCSGMQKSIGKLCKDREHHLFLADSPEMLALIPDDANETKVPGFFPQTAAKIKEMCNGIDVVICYSVFHYIFCESNLWVFLDELMAMLSHEGQILLGDIPNISKRKRFFASPTGINFHQDFTKSKEIPSVEFNRVEAGKIDDAILHSVVMHCQAAGCDAYIVPQPDGLPFSNRRDDILIRKP